MSAFISPNLSAIKKFCPTDRSSGFLLHGALVTFVRLHTSQFGSFGKNEKWCFPPILFEVGFSGDCEEGRSADGGPPRQLEIRLSNLNISSSMLPCMVEAILVFQFPHVARGRPQLVPGSSSSELRSGVRLRARLGPPRECGCRFNTRFLQLILDEI